MLILVLTQMGYLLAHVDHRDSPENYFLWLGDNEYVPCLGKAGRVYEVTTLTVASHVQLTRLRVCPPFRVSSCVSVCRLRGTTSSDSDYPCPTVLGHTWPHTVHSTFGHTWPHTVYTATADSPSCKHMTITVCCVKLCLYPTRRFMKVSVIDQ